MNNMVIVLGAPNDSQGNLSQIARDRLNYAYDFYNANSDLRVVCTGGFGDHFNTTDKPHHYYSMKYLVEKGIPEAAFLDAPLSSNTIEDFQLIKDLVITENPDVLTVITSDFHMKRAQILCNRIINYPKVIFIPAPSSLSKEELVPLIEHETRAIKRLNKKSFLP